MCLVFVNDNYSEESFRLSLPFENPDVNEDNSRISLVKRNLIIECLLHIGYEFIECPKKLESMKCQ